MGQARPEQMESVQAEFFRRRTKCQTAQTELRSAKLAESGIECELSDAEGGFAQERLLEFINKRKYALHPFNIANAMAGLPYATDVEFLGVWMSRERCAKIPAVFGLTSHTKCLPRSGQFGTISACRRSHLSISSGEDRRLTESVKPIFPKKNRGNKKGHELSSATNG